MADAHHSVICFCPAEWELLIKIKIRTHQWHSLHRTNSVSANFRIRRPVIALYKSKYATSLLSSAKRKSYYHIYTAPLPLYSWKFVVHIVLKSGQNLYKIIYFTCWKLTSSSSLNILSISSGGRNNGLCTYARQGCIVGRVIRSLGWSQCLTIFRRVYIEIIT